VVNAKTYLMFSLYGSTYAADSAAVREILWLPELTPIEEAPPWIAGVFNLRGKIIPVMDLSIRFGHEPRPLNVNDAVIVIERDNATMGVMVNEALRVEDIERSMIDGPIEYPGLEKRSHHLIEGEAKTGGEIVMILDLAKLLRHEDIVKISGSGVEEPVPDKERKFAPGASPKEIEIFRERARNLIQPVEEMDFGGLTPFAVISIGGERFAVELGFIAEFANLKGLAPAPCCPPRIAGNMNLRGDIITVVDIRGFLGLAVGAPSAGSKIMVIKNEEIVAGILVDEAYDVVYLPVSSVVAAPVAVKSEAGKFLKGACPMMGMMLGVIDIGKILESGELIVNETV